ncbi:MAG: prepilin-type N-terminal cleavage/methylation domain-containing protein [Candidatus Omnitrophica bacterium]|nr:hypothetical protein [bacterium]NUN98305.1 prepilin-type N-terminal cleavage/methylation domain-containing protein [Candidatus Omnitrophota bacterium]
MSRPRGGSRAFTLIEMLVVIVIILILASAAFFLSRKAIDRAKEASRQAGVRAEQTNRFIPGYRSPTPTPTEP